MPNGISKRAANHCVNLFEITAEEKQQKQKAPGMNPRNNSHNQPFDETEFIRLLFLISDTQSWINEMEKQLFLALPLPDKKKLFRRTWYLNATSLAHILERHYHKIPRNPGAGKFTISVAEIVYLIREGYHHPSLPLPGTLNNYCSFETGNIIGFDRSGQPSQTITIIAGPGGGIITAFPGQLFLPKTN